MNGQKHTIGLFGGTFDPVHIGHILIAEQIAEQKGLESVIFIPSARPPHKRPNGIMFTADERLAMLKLATGGNPRFSVSDIEIKREGPSYTIDTIRQMKASFPEPVDLCFIVGIDNLYEIQFWKNPESIIDECRLVAAKRPCDEAGAVPEWLKDRVEIVDVPLIDVSSSDIRQRLRNGRSIRYLVPDAVYDYIMSRNT